MHSTQHLMPTLAVLSLTAAAGAQVLERSGAPVPAPQADVKTAAPLEQLALPAPPARPSGSGAQVPAEAAESAVVELTPAPAGIAFDRVRYQDAPDGALWARGASYKMRFDAHSASVLPYFSPRAPKNFELVFDLREVSVDGTALELADAAALRHGDDLVTLDHGLVDERYQLGLERIEQSFVIEALPASGALRLRLGATTELTGTSDADGFTFQNDWGRVSYGRATAIDARGRSLALESELSGGEIVITVPAAFTATAALPLVIDPVIAIFGVETSASTAFSADCSFDFSGGGVLHVYNVPFSANDWDVGGYATDRYGNVWAGSFFWNDFSAAHWVRPRVAHNGATDRFLVAAEVGPVGSRAIWGQVRSVFSNSINVPQLLSGPEVGEKFNVDVGGDPWGALPSYFCIVYERNLSATDHDIHAQLVDTLGVRQTTPGTIFVDNSGSTLDAFPTVSKSNRTSTWNLAWQRDVTGQSTRIFGARVSWGGAITAAPFQISLFSLPQRRPSVSSPLADATHYLVVCEADYSSDNDIYAYSVNNNVVEQSINISEADFGTLFRDQREPSVDTDGGHYMTAFMELTPGIANNYDVFASEVQLSGTSPSVRQHRMALATTGAREGQPQIASHESSHPNHGGFRDYVAIYDRGIGSGAGTTDDVFAALVEGTYGGQIESFCTRSQVSCPCASGAGSTGCPNSGNAAGALMSAYGVASTGADTLGFQITGMRPNSTCMVFQGTGLINSGFGNVLGDGVRCVGGLIARFAPHQNDAGGNSFHPQSGNLPISLQGAVPYIGGTYYYQTWYRDTAAFCTGDTTNLSNGLKVTWTP